MSFTNIFKIDESIIYKEQDNILFMRNYNSDISIEFLKSVVITVQIGYSMNLKYIQIKLNNQVIKLEKITKINLTVQSGDKITIIPSKSDLDYEIYFNVKNIKRNKTDVSGLNFINGEDNLSIISETDISDDSKVYFYYTNLNQNELKNNQLISKNSWLHGIKKIIIITTRLIKSIADFFKIIFSRVGIICEIKYKLEISDCFDAYNLFDTIFIILFNDSKHFLLPNRFIYYQIEQSNSIFLTDNKFKHKLKFSCMKAEKVWEFTSVTRHIYEKYCKNRLIWVPMPFVFEPIENQIEWEELKYDIFFFGTKNSRRDKILNELKKHFNVKIGYGIFDEKKINYIIKSKIILNLHFYKEAGLETCRFNEILNFNKIIISELPAKQDWYNVKLYKKSVIFIDEIKDDLSNINLLYEQLDKYLNNINEYNKQIKLNTANNKIISTNSQFNFIKLLLSLNMDINHKIDYHLIPNTIYCLHLIETPFRIDAFNKQTNKPDVEIFPAVKYNPGWIGCALSYVNLIYNAKRCNLDKITICEDDCRFPDNFQTIYNNINYALNKINKWDIFVGCIADLHENTIINNVYKYKDITFIEINKMTSMVFNIYNNSCFDTIINWDVNNLNKETNTIDRYIEVANLKIITTYPYCFDCLNVDSTLWGSNFYDLYNNMFETSLNIIKKKLDAWNKPIINL